MGCQSTGCVTPESIESTLCGSVAYAVTGSGSDLLSLRTREILS